MDAPVDRPLEIGICIPNFRAGTSPAAMLAAAETAERLGWGSAWTTDHLLVDDNVRATDYREIHEALTVLAWLAGRTTTIRLGISVLVVPMRNAIVAAKELATIDAVSDGRLIAGVGIGWNEAEFETVGVGELFGQRGAFLEETVALWRHLWGGGTSFAGRFHTVDGGHFGPVPPQGADIPIWIGAHAETAIARAGRIAQGYHSTFTDAATLTERRRIIATAAETAGRPMPTISARLRVFLDRDGPAASLRGSPADVRSALDGYRAAGVEHIALDFGETEAEPLVDVMERFDREVLAAR